MSYWVRKDFATRMAFDSDMANEPKPVILAKVDVDPLTRGMIAAISTTTVDEFGGTGDISLKYWYRRQNGQANLIHLFDVKVNEDGDELEIEEIYYRNKPLIGHLPPELQKRPCELLLDAIREINQHLREGGSPKEISKILHEYDIPAIIGEDIILPGQNAQGAFSFKITDSFNLAAQGKLVIQNDKDLMQTIIQGEINTLDTHRRLDAPERQTFATHKTTGTTFRGTFFQERRPRSTEMGIKLEPAVQSISDRSKPMPNFMRQQWDHKTAENDNFVLKAFKFLNQDISVLSTDMQIRVLGASYKILDLFRRKRYPTALDIMHEFDLLDLFSPIEPPTKEGRFYVISYLGNGKEEVVEGFGLDLGACKAVCHEKLDEDGKIKREIVILDLGKMLAPTGSDWDGGLPDVINILKDTKAIYISHRHLDHMGAIIELTRLGVLKGITIHAAPRVNYILNNQLRAEVDDKSLLPDLNNIEGEGIHHYEHLSAEYGVDAINHSTKCTAVRVLGRKTTKTENLTEKDVFGSYLFCGDIRDVDKPEFLSRGQRSFGINRQDTYADFDITNAKKPGPCATAQEIDENKIDSDKCFADRGHIISQISTNDENLQSEYRGFNRNQRNFTGVGHNMEMSLRAQNINGVDPEYLEKRDKDNINFFLENDAREETELRTAHLREELETETDPERIQELYDQIEALTLHPVKYKTRGSYEAKSWLDDDLGKVAILVTGTQGSDGEIFSIASRAAEGWSTLDMERHTSYLIKDPSKWCWRINQGAIPGNHEAQRKLIHKLLNRYHHVRVAIEDGFKIFGLNNDEKEEFKSQFLGKNNRKSYDDEDGALVITGAPIYRTGHGHKENIRRVAKIANADISSGTHSNDPENTVAFHQICDEEGLRHEDRQFDDFEILEIDMGSCPAEAKIMSLGHEHKSMILFKIVREFGKFFGGTLRAKRVTKLEGTSGFGQYGIMGETGNDTFEHDVIVGDFAKASRRRHLHPDNKTMPHQAMMSQPLDERRYRGPKVPRNVRPNERKLRKIRDLAAKVAERMVA